MRHPFYQSVYQYALELNPTFARELEACIIRWKSIYISIDISILPIALGETIDGDPLYMTYYVLQS